MAPNTELVTWIQQRGRELGFFALGIATVEPMDATPFQSWLNAGYHAEMDYLLRHLPLRANLQQLLPGAKSVICAAMPYPGPHPGEEGLGDISYFARCHDYHDVLQHALQQLWGGIHQRNSISDGRVFVDSGPLPERELARRAGLGWIGKHSCLIHPKLGTRFVLGEILTTLALPSSQPQQGSCGECQACQQACPTGALLPDGVVDARKCVSYLTIELKGPIPRELRAAIGTRVFGCDSCQNACPHNKTIQLKTSGALHAVPEFIWPELIPLLYLTPAGFEQRFKGTPMYRAKRRGLLRNICVALGNGKNDLAIPALRWVSNDADPLIRGHACWALGQLGDRVTLRAALLREQDDWVRDEISTALANLGKR